MKNSMKALTMPNSISRDDFIGVLKDGVRRTAEFMADVTEYHGGPAFTEYLLTSDIARAMISKHFQVKVECRRRDFLNPLIVPHGARLVGRFSSSRADIGVFDGPLFPRAIVEVKTGVGGTLRKVIPDLERNCNILSSMTANSALAMQAAAVFEVHVRGRSCDFKLDRLKTRISAIEAKLKAELTCFAKSQPSFFFEFVPLQDRNQGYTPTEIEDEHTDHPTLGRNGHATRYYAILIKSSRQPDPNESIQYKLWSRRSADTNKPG